MVLIGSPISKALLDWESVKMANSLTYLVFLLFRAVLAQPLEGSGGLPVNFLGSREITISILFLEFSKGGPNFFSFFFCRWNALDKNTGNWDLHWNIMSREFFLHLAHEVRVYFCFCFINSAPPTGRAESKVDVFLSLSLSLYSESLQLFTMSWI